VVEAPRSIAGDPIDNGPQVDDPAAGVITTVAGGSADGQAALQSTFFQPQSAAVAPDGTVYITDTYDNRVRAIPPSGTPVLGVAGTGDAGYAGDGGLATAASLNFSRAIAVHGAAVVVGDTWNDRIREVDRDTGMITTLAGIGPDDAVGDPPCGQGIPGPATSAVLVEPEGLAVARNGDVYIADTGCDAVERVEAATGNITVVAGVEGLAGVAADGAATGQKLDHPFAVALDPLGNPVFSDDTNRLFYVNQSTAPVTLFPASVTPIVVGPGQLARIAGDGNVPVPPPADGDGGPAIDAELASPHGLSTAADGSVLFEEDEGYSNDVALGYMYTMRVRRIDWASGVVTQVAGDDQLGAGDDGVPATQSALAYPEAAFVTPDGGIDVVDMGNDRVRHIDAATGLIATSAGRPNRGSPPLGDGLPATAATLNWPRAAAVNPNNDALYVSDSLGLRIRRVDPSTGVITTIVGGGMPCVRAGVGWHVECENDGTPPDSEPGPAMRLFYNDGTAMTASGSGLLAFIDEIDQAVWVYNDSPTAVHLYTMSGSPLNVLPGYVQRIAGGGSTAPPLTGSLNALDASLKFPSGVAFDGTGTLYVSEQLANRVDVVDLRSGQLSILTGAPYTVPSCVGPLPFIGCVAPPERDTYLDGPLATAHFFQPAGLSVARDGSVYVADIGNNRIRKIDLAQGLVTTVAGDGLQGFQGDGGAAIAAELVYPTDVAAASDGSLLITDWGNERIRRVDSLGIIRTFAGTGLSRVGNACGSTVPCGHYSGDGGPGPAATLNFPFDGSNFSALGPDGRLYIGDTLNNRIRAVQLLTTPTPATPESPMGALLLMAGLAGAVATGIASQRGRRARRARV
jgi:sugar lactone lactonase YvrE